MTVQAIKMTTPGDVVAAVPYLLGFQPEESVVIIALADRQIMVTGRLDISSLREMLPQVGEAFVTSGIDGAVIVGYGDDGASSVATTASFLEDLDIEVHLRLEVHNGTWHCLVTGEKGQVDESAPIALQLATTSGSYGTREALVASCWPDENQPAIKEAYSNLSPMPSTKALSIILGWEEGDYARACATYYLSVRVAEQRDWLYRLMSLPWGNLAGIVLPPELKQAGIAAGALNGDSTTVDPKDVATRLILWARNAWEDNPELAAHPLAIGAVAGWANGNSVQAETFLDRIDACGLGEEEPPAANLTRRMVYNGIGPNHPMLKGQA